MNWVHLLGYDFQTKQYTELQHMAWVLVPTEQNPVHDERTRGSGTTPPNHLLLKQSTCFSGKKMGLVIWRTSIKLKQYNMYLAIMTQHLPTISLNFDRYSCKFQDIRDFIWSTRIKRANILELPPPPSLIPNYLVPATWIMSIHSALSKTNNFMLSNIY